MALWGGRLQGHSCALWGWWGLNMLMKTRVKMRAHWRTLSLHSSWPGLIGRLWRPGPLVLATSFLKDTNTIHHHVVNKSSVRQTWYCNNFYTCDNADSDFFCTNALRNNRCTWMNEIWEVASGNLSSESQKVTQCLWKKQNLQNLFVSVNSRRLGSKSEQSPPALTFQHRHMLTPLSVVPDLIGLRVPEIHLVVSVPSQQLVHGAFCKRLREKKKKRPKEKSLIKVPCKLIG